MSNRVREPACEPHEFKRRRALLTVTASEFAAVAGVSVKTVGAWEQGRFAVPRWALLVLDVIEDKLNRGERILP